MHCILHDLSLCGSVLVVGDTNARVADNVDDKLVDGDDVEEVELLSKE